MTTQFVQPYEGKKKLLDFAKSSCWVRLFKAISPSLSEHTVYADLTTSAFPGYADQQPTFSSTANDGSDNAESHTGVVTFTCTGGGTTENAVGVVVLFDNSGSPDNHIYCVYVFPSPITMFNNGDVVSFSVLQLLQGQYPL